MDLESEECLDSEFLAGERFLFSLGCLEPNGRDNDVEDGIMTPQRNDSSLEYMWIQNQVW